MPTLIHKLHGTKYPVTIKGFQAIMGNPLLRNIYKVQPTADIPEEVAELIAAKKKVRRKPNTK